VRIGASHEGDTVTTWVEDEGSGGPDLEAGAIFERFSRGSGEEPEPGGLGLGLWIVKSIVERHGGKIAARRTPAGKTRFEVQLRVARE
jgi:signal transduction histidine kinase